jgi:hypothetical protein
LAPREFAAAGGLIGYGAILTDAYRLTGVYTGRVLAGAKPADLPVQQSTKVSLDIKVTLQDFVSTEHLVWGQVRVPSNLHGEFGEDRKVLVSARGIPVLKRFHHGISVHPGSLIP